MTDEQFRRLRRLAGRAESLLADEDFKLMLADLKHQAIREWSEAPTADLREKAWHDLHAVGRLEATMVLYGQTFRTEKAHHGID